MGDGEAVISLKHLRDNFGIRSGSPDDQLIERATAGLRFVPDIRPGDAIPNEILNGTASWTVGPRHKRIARERIQAQLVAWTTGKPLTAAGAEELKAHLEQESVKQALREAFKRAATALGYAATDTERVLERIETLARELCYIEALRERCGQVKRIRELLDRLTKAYTNDQRVVDEIGRCKLLMTDGLRELYAPLAELDAKIADVMNALQTVDTVIAAVRQTRDDIHFVLMAWDPVIAHWEKLEPNRGQAADRALHALYHLLAGRFATGKSLMKRRK
jgi:hypothetical protein